MGIFHFEEHKVCKNFVSKIRVGFKYTTLQKGEAFIEKNKHENHLLFIMDGQVTVSYDEHPSQLITSGEMFFLPKMTNCYGSTLTIVKAIVLAYDAPVNLCDTLALEALSPYCEQITYQFKGMEIRPVLMHFLRLLSSYLKDGISCSHLHEIKQRELFLLLRTYYNKEEMAHFFYPVIDHSLSFRSKVMAHYQISKNVKMLASACGYSMTVFNRKFQEEFNEAPYQWILQQLAPQIKIKLAQQEVTLKDISEEFHFSSVSHFTTYCKRQFGNTPAQIRQLLCSKDQ